MPRHKRNVRGVGEGAAAGAVDFGGYYLVEHSGIIAWFGYDVSYSGRTVI